MSWRSERARLAVTIRDHPNDHERIDAIRRDMRAEQLADHIRRVVDTFPPLTADQRGRLALLLQGGGDDAAP
jgi:hypothetical protein